MWRYLKGIKQFYVLWFQWVAAQCIIMLQNRTAASMLYLVYDSSPICLVLNGRNETLVALRQTGMGSVQIVLGLKSNKERKMAAHLFERIKAVLCLVVSLGSNLLVYNASIEVSSLLGYICLWLAVQSFLMLHNKKKLWGIKANWHGEGVWRLVHKQELRSGNGTLFPPFQPAKM